MSSPGPGELLLVALLTVLPVLAIAFMILRLVFADPLPGSDGTGTHAAPEELALARAMDASGTPPG